MAGWQEYKSRHEKLNLRKSLQNGSKSTQEEADPGGVGGVLPYNSYTGMCRPTGSYFWDFDLKRGIIFTPFL